MSKDNKKKSNSLQNILIIGGIIILAIVAIVAFTNNSSTGNAISNLNSEKVCKEVQVPYDYIEEYQETVPYTDTECETKNLAYNVENFVMDYNTCNEYQDICNKYILGICSDKTTFCVDKSVSCSLDLRNLDTEEQGSWTIRFSFYETGTTNLIIDSKDVIQFLYPQTTKTFTGISRIQSEGVDGDANKQITCSYIRETIPTKQICKDVTKYKEVTKTRTVTRYRTEEKCE
jgi:hypothetical protein